MPHFPGLSRTLSLTVAAAIILITRLPRTAIRQQTPPATSASVPATASTAKPPAIPQAANPDALYAPFATEFSHVASARKVYSLGGAAAHAKQDGRAGAAFTRALALRHRYPEALRERELASERLKQWRAAIVDLTRMIDENPRGNRYFYSRRSIAYFNLGDYAEAMSDHEKADTPLNDAEELPIWGPTRSAKYTAPNLPALPDSLKDKTIDATVTILVTFGWNGHVKTILKKSAGPGLTTFDDLSLKAFSGTAFTPGLENGLPVDDPRLFTFRYKNPPQPKTKISRRAIQSSKPMV